MLTFKYAPLLTRRKRLALRASLKCSPRFACVVQFCLALRPLADILKNPKRKQRTVQLRCPLFATLATLFTGESFFNR